MRYLMTHSLLSSWLHAMKENPYEDLNTERDPMEEFMQTLRREPTPPTEAMQNGIKFEGAVTAAVNGRHWGNENWYDAAAKIAARVRGGISQVKVNRIVQLGDITLVLHGRLDWLRAGEIIDVKFSKSYDRGKYFSSTQHPMYFELVPEAARFTYLVSNGSEVWEETYRRDETRSVFFDIKDFLVWLQMMDLMGLYQEKWGAK